MKKYTEIQVADKICELEAYEEYLQDTIGSLEHSETKIKKCNELRRIQRQLNSLKGGWYFE